MKCLHAENYINKHSFSNHRRWCEGKMSPESYKGINLGEKNNMWRGDQISPKAGLHVWVNRNIDIPKECLECGSIKNLDLANITGIYNRDFINWAYLCRKHHMLSDGRMDNLRKGDKWRNNFV